MIIGLGNQSPEDAVHVLESALAALGGRTHRQSITVPRLRKYAAITPREARIERERMRTKVFGTRELVGSLARALEAMQHDALASLGLREAKATSAGMEHVDLDPRHLIRAFKPVLERMVLSGWESAHAELAAVAAPKREATATVSTGFEVYPQAAIDALYAATLEFSLDVVEREKVALKHLIMAGLAAGESSDEIAQHIRQFFADGMHFVDDAGEIVRTLPADSWIQTVARTEVAKANNAGVIAFYEQAGVEEVVYLAAADCCDICAELDGQQFAIDDTDQLPPQHPNCCPPGTMIETIDGLRPIEEIRVGDLVLTHRARFRRVLGCQRNEVAADLIVLRAGDCLLRVTEGHPVLTSDGWTLAGALEPGCEVRCVEAEAVIALPAEPNEVPASDRERSLLAFVATALPVATVPPSAIDLDCEAAFGKGDVDTHGLEREVRNRIEFGRAQHVEHDALVARLDTALSALGALDQFGCGSLYAANGSVCSRREARTLVVAGVDHTHEHRSAAVAPFEPKPSPIKTETPPCDPDAGRQGFDRHAVLDVFPMEGARSHVGEFALCNSASANGSELSLLTGKHIAIVPLSSATRMAYTGPVYNFEVDEDESYVAEGIVVHNCRCVTIAASSL